MSQYYKEYNEESGLWEILHVDNPDNPLAEHITEEGADILLSHLRKDG